MSPSLLGYYTLSPCPGGTELVPQLQSSPGVYRGEIGHSGYIYPAVEVVFEGLSLEEKSGFTVVEYL